MRFKLFNLFKYIIISALALIFAGCAVGPDYEPLSTNELNIPLKWHAVLPHGGNNMQMIKWWEQFNDPVLLSFIESAIATNPTLAQSVAKISQAQANLTASRSYFYPSITATGSAAAQNNLDTGVSNGTTSNSGSVDFINSATGATSSYTAGLNASWELDLFGAIRRNTQVYQARLEAAKANWNDARISLAAQVADTYVNARECQALLMIYESQYAARTSTQRLTDLKVNSGFAPVSDSNQGFGLAMQSKSNIEKQKSSCAIFNNELAALTSLPYAVVESKMELSYADIPVPVNTTVSAVPANILSQRPDVSSAERSVAAAVANVGVAIANRYPSITLTGSISANAGSLYTNQPNSWSFGPGITLPLTDGGYLRAQVSLARAQYDEAVAVYKNKVLIAVKEVENALVRVNLSHKRALAAQSAVKYYQDYFSSMNTKYQIGWSNLLDLETVRINLVSYQQNAAEANLEEAQAWIALYKAVGGSWVAVN